jgi:predicted transcriptional regulator
MKIQRMKDVIAEMRSVASGEIQAPSDAAAPTVESTDALVRLLTPDNRNLLRIIRDVRPQSVAELARLTNRAEPNLLRTLGKLEAFGFVEMRLINHRRIPTSIIGTLHLDIDPYTMSDKIEYRSSTWTRPT